MSSSKVKSKPARQGRPRLRERGYIVYAGGMLGGDHACFDPDANILVMRAVRHAGMDRNEVAAKARDMKFNLDNACASLRYVPHQQMQMIRRLKSFYEDNGSPFTH